MLIAFSLLAPVVSVVAPAQAGIDASINNATAPVARWVGEVVFFKIPLFGAQLPVVVLWLIVGAVFFTFYMKFVNLRGFRHAIHLVRGIMQTPNARVRFRISKRWQQRSLAPLVLVISVVWPWPLLWVGRVPPSG